MKQYLLAGTSALALLVGAAGADATTFNFTGKVVDFTIPVTGTYDITAAGAEGGASEGEQLSPRPTSVIATIASRSRVNTLAL